MKRNVGGFDRTWRLVGGAILVAVGLASFAGLLSVGTTVAAILIVAGAVFFATGVVQKCTINRLLGIDTYRKDAETDAESMDETPAKRAS
ncbi:DUF2892 domain-containing protein [Natronococcus pandeyae]|uniref:DUF2892 domain-containing protein n=1 Tax=Natronococcus pandeyae TaxID=2055836 RepID=A0A8J8Q8F2_9EURY|nr:DUF2892 domain-containing protein [Natronococcus pandeyae]TYL40413.1 DUF2892 domain-containing protein [Natronococcus pandeyae]